MTTTEEVTVLLDTVQGGGKECAFNKSPIFISDRTWNLLHMVFYKTVIILSKSGMDLELTGQ